jgi:AhpD family alkylhydroperoxidase
MAQTLNAPHTSSSGVQESSTGIASAGKQAGRQNTPIGHVGLRATNLAASVEFYKDLFGMEITGGSGPGHPIGATAFLTSRPGEQAHEIALVADPEIAHTAFRVSSLAELRSFHARVVERKIPIKFAFNHHESFAIYFDDPGGNLIEVYWPTGNLSTPQPYVEPLDLSQPDEVLLETITAAPVANRKTNSKENSVPNYPVHTIASAPEGSKAALEQLKEAFGVLPNLPAVIANSPKLINSLVGLFGQVHSPGLSEPENQIVLLTDAVTNACTYAVAFHTALALQQGISTEETTAIRERRLPKDKRFAALSSLAKTLIEKRGHLSEQELDSFLSAGFTKEQIFEVIAIVAASTITNYAGTIGNPPLDEPFRPYAWQK